MRNAKISELERQRTIMEYAVPLVRYLQAELSEKAVNEALKSWTSVLAAEAENGPSPKYDFAAFEDGISVYAEDNALDYELLKNDGETLEFNVTRCKYAELLHSLGAADVGPLLRCNHDYAEAFEGGLRLKRTQTLMEGAPHCDFRYVRK
jgi:hypothetical protein